MSSAPKTLKKAGRMGGYHGSMVPPNVPGDIQLQWKKPSYLPEGGGELWQSLVHQSDILAFQKRHWRS